MFKPQITTYEQSRFDGEKVIFPDHPEDITPEDWHIDKIWHYIAESVRDMAEEHRPKKYPFPRFQIGTSTKEKTFLNGKIPVQRELDLSMPGPEMVMHPIVPMLDGVPISSEPRIFLQTTSDQLVHGILLRIPRVIDEIYFPRGTITEFTAFLSVIWDLCMLLYIDPKYKDLDLTRAITSGNVESVLTLGNSLQKVPQIPKADTQTFAVPITRARRKYVTAATHSDSFGKERWRHGIVDFTGTIYPGGIKSLPEEKRFTICFPGIGKEAFLWKELGVPEEALIMVEDQPEVVTKLRRLFPQAIIIPRKFAVGRTQDSSKEYHKKYFLDPIQRKIQERASKGKISIINVDPENRLTNSLRAGVANLLSMDQLAQDVFLGLNVVGGRESRSEQDALDEIVQIGEGNNLLKPDQASHPGKSASMHQKRTWAIGLAAKGICAQSSTYAGGLAPNHVVTNQLTGSYEGDGATRMYFSFSHLTRINK